MKQTPELAALKEALEKFVQRKMNGPTDYEYLSDAIKQKQKEGLNPTTLKRMWGYIGGAETPRRSTLDILSKFLGYEDWDGFLKHLADNSAIESSFFSTRNINSKDLAIGNRVAVSWHPNRRCEFEYLGDARFKVLSSLHAKLRPGDTFECLSFMQNQPLYLSNLIQGENEAVSYVAGAKGGLVMVEVTG
ncbi:hypothetical protein [Bacteroides sp. 519]|uniref:hypothetical protein n=1 Tax=Bacteroides sp. 519 TaxID=2302937 RepID=UPI0013D38837|nr:hypothetical protein [Bacteroides sp. 519]NDV57645.1 hypothetical protein [Bacteroides sp. 519]